MFMDFDQHKTEERSSAVKNGESADSKRHFVRNQQKPFVYMGFYRQYCEALLFRCFYIVSHSLCSAINIDEHLNALRLQTLYRYGWLVASRFGSYGSNVKCKFYNNWIENGLGHQIWCLPSGNCVVVRHHKCPLQQFDWCKAREIEKKINNIK